MDLLCDEMLKGLARWLRAAGHDAALAKDGETDRELLARAHDSGRLLLTRDRKLLEYRGASALVRLLECNDLDSCARELRQKLDLDWLYRPFTRCLLCNLPLSPVTDTVRVPQDVSHAALLQCPGCRRVFWEGSHTRRMRDRLQQWVTATRAPEAK